MRKDCMGVQGNCELLTIRGRLCVCLTFRLAHKVTMFAVANAMSNHVGGRSRGLRAPCREAPPRCFS